MTAFGLVMLGKLVLQVAYAVQINLNNKKINQVIM